MYAIKVNYTQSIQAVKLGDGFFVAAQDCWLQLPPHILFFFPRPSLDSFLSFLSARSREKHSGRGRGGSIQREGEKDQKTKDYLFEFTTSGSEPKISADAVSGVTGESGARCLAGSHSDAGESTTHAHTHNFTIIIMIMIIIHPLSPLILCR